MTYSEELDMLNEGIASMQEKGERVPGAILNNALLLGVKRDCYQEGVADTEAKWADQAKEAIKELADQLALEHTRVAGLVKDKANQLRRKRNGKAIMEQRQADERAKVEALVVAGQKLASRHKGWESGMGGCVCHAHKEWDAALAETGINPLPPSRA